MIKGVPQRVDEEKGNCDNQVAKIVGEIVGEERENLMGIVVPSCRSWSREKKNGGN